MKEVVDEADEKNNLTGKSVDKIKAHVKGIWHRAAHIWILNSKNDVLLQLRSKEKDIFPGYWDISAAGHVSSGETPVVAALRELEEELGVKVDKDDLEFFGVKKYDDKFNDFVIREFCYLYFINIDSEKFVLQKEEVEKVKFFSLKELKELKKVTPHVKYMIPVFERLFDKK